MLFCRSVVLLKDLEAGEELFADYGYLEQYVNSESMVKSIFHVGKWFMNKSDEDFHKDMKFHIKYMKKKVKDLRPYMKNVEGLRPYMAIFKTIMNMI
mgnify:CR=1 FL=1